jgi:SAM-dependent methyltransferase
MLGEAMHAQTHRSDARILGRRTLERDHKKLAELLRPGKSVLDAGCGTGAITAGIARAVAPGGVVVGVDRDAALLEIARRDHGAVDNLRFEQRGATDLGYRSAFDIVTAARTLQWIDGPLRALEAMREAAKPAGLIVVLDYNHLRNEWEPEPPRAFRDFYRAFLAWRTDNGWDNAIADRLPELFRLAGLEAVEVFKQDESAACGEPDFAEKAAIWSGVIESLGAQVVSAGHLTATQLQDARETYNAWAAVSLNRQTLSMCTVVGVVKG